jgi:hypothetical protein
MADLATIIIADDVVKVPFILEFKVFSVILRLFDSGKNNSGHGLWFLLVMGLEILLY